MVDDNAGLSRRSVDVFAAAANVIAHRPDLRILLSPDNLRPGIVNKRTDYIIVFQAVDRAQLMRAPAEKSQPPGSEN